MENQIRWSWVHVFTWHHELELSSLTSSPIFHDPNSSSALKPRIRNPGSSHTYWCVPYGQEITLVPGKMKARPRKLDIFIFWKYLSVWLPQILVAALRISSVIVVHRLCCSLACGILVPRPRIEPSSPGSPEYIGRWFRWVRLFKKHN